MERWDRSRVTEELSEFSLLRSKLEKLAGSIISEEEGGEKRNSLGIFEPGLLLRGPVRASCALAAGPVGNPTVTTSPKVTLQPRLPSRIPLSILSAGCGSKTKNHRNSKNETSSSHDFTFCVLFLMLLNRN